VKITMFGGEITITLVVESAVQQPSFACCTGLN